MWDIKCHCLILNYFIVQEKLQQLDGYKKALGEIDFCNYENFHNVNDAHSNFIKKIMEFIDKVILIKDLLGNSQEWFDNEVSEKLTMRVKHFKKYKIIRLHVDKEISETAHCSVKIIIEVKHSKTILEITVEIKPQPAALDFKNLVSIF